MKRSIGSLTLMAMAVGAFAQTNFTIVRPVDNAKVREKVKIQFPKGSIPAGGYVGIFLNGQLIDAVVPPVQGKYNQYILDTKGRGLPDTTAGKPDRLEAKLFMDYNGQPRIVRTSSVDLNIANTASIKVPNSGFKLRYRFQAGTEIVYRMTQRVAVDTISESQNKLGGRPAELPIDTETVRMKYAIDNAYGNGDGLVRMQAMPQQGKDYAILTVGDGTEGAKKYSQNDMAAIYMRLTPTGREVFGSIPTYWPLEGTASSGSRLDLFAAFPLPSLPEKSVRPGDSWNTGFQNGKLDMEKLYAQTSVVNRFGPARGEFVGVEWEMGHPCAKIKNTITEGQMTNAQKALVKSGAQFGGDKISLDETVWFALDTRQVVKVLRDTTLEMKQEGAGAGGYGGGSMGGNSGGPPPGYGDPGAPGRGGDPRRGGGDDKQITNLMQRQKFGPPQGDRTSQGTTPSNNNGGRAGFGGGPGAGEAQFIRIRIQRIFVLEP